MIEVDSGCGAQGREKDVGDIGVTEFRERSAGFDERL
jgi:hypothetical protein